MGDPDYWNGVLSDQQTGAREFALTYWAGSNHEAYIANRQEFVDLSNNWHGTESQLEKVWAQYSLEEYNNGYSFQDLMNDPSTGPASQWSRDHVKGAYIEPCSSTSCGHPMDVKGTAYVAELMSAQSKRDYALAQANA